MTTFSGKLCADGLVAAAKQILSGKVELPMTGTLRKCDGGTVIDLQHVFSIEEVPRSRRDEGPRVIKVGLNVREDEEWEFKPKQDAKHRPVFVTTFE